MLLRHGSDVAFRGVVGAGMMALRAGALRVRRAKFPGTLRTLAVSRCEVARAARAIPTRELIAARIAVWWARAIAIKKRWPPFGAPVA